jgi:CheY-like chemotaxis protein
MTCQAARVLVVDDKLPLASLLREFLRGWGHTPELASTGAAALELFRKSRMPRRVLRLRAETAVLLIATLAGWVPPSERAG